MKLLLTGAFKYSKAQLDTIRALGFEVICLEQESSPLQVDVTEVEAVVCNSLFFHQGIRQFKNLKFIQLLSAGLDRVPLEYIEQKGIRLYNAGDVYSIPMAEWAVLKILEIYKDSRHFYRAQNERRWEKKRDLLELAGKKAAIIGLGNVGQATAKRLKAFGVEITGIDIRKVESEFTDHNFMIDRLDEALKQSDIIILTLPLNEETRHLINADRLKFMDDKSVLVNLSRGGIIDEAALVSALQNGKFRGIALDVFEEEPLPPDNPLWGFDRVIITPHNSYVSDKVQERLFKLILDNLSMNNNAEK